MLHGEHDLIYFCILNYAKILMSISVAYAWYESPPNLVHCDLVPSYGPRSDSPLMQIMAYCLTTPNITWTNIDVSSVRFCSSHRSQDRQGYEKSYPLKQSLNHRLDFGQLCPKPVCLSHPISDRDQCWYDWKLVAKYFMLCHWYCDILSGDVNVASPSNPSII